MQAMDEDKKEVKRFGAPCGVLNSPRNTTSSCAYAFRNIAQKVREAVAMEEEEIMSPPNHIPWEEEASKEADPT
jgi:hypothetical protein